MPLLWRKLKTRIFREMKNVSVEELQRLYAGSEAAEQKRTNVKKLENLIKRQRASDKPIVVTELESSSLMIGVPAHQE